MVLKSKSFLISQGSNLSNVALFLNNNLDLNAYQIKDLQVNYLNGTNTQVTVFYLDYPELFVDSTAPSIGSVFTTGSTNNFDIRLLFNSPIDKSSINSGSFSIDGTAVGIGSIFVNSNYNNYFVKVSASGSSFVSENIHTYKVSPSLKRADGSQFNSPFVGGYTLHSLSDAFPGSLYKHKYRGLVDIGLVKLNTSVQASINGYFTQRNLPLDTEIICTAVLNTPSSVELYFIYLSKPEPQVISGFPLSNSLFPSTRLPAKLTLTFNTELDRQQFNSSLFNIESDFSTSTSVSFSDAILLTDNRTVEIDLSSYVTSQKIYSLIVKPGLRSSLGAVKYKPDQWVINVGYYASAAASTGGGSTGSLSGISDATFAGHTGRTDNPHVVTAAQVGAPTTAQFTGHTGDTSLHYTKGSIPHSGLLGLTGDDHLHYLTTGRANGWLTGNLNFTGHTGNASIHFTQSQISITSTQVSDFNDSVGSLLSTNISVYSGLTLSFPAEGLVSIGMSGWLYTGITGHIGNTGIHFTQSQISIPSSQISNFTAGVTGLAPTIAQFTGHTGDASIHFAQSAISITSSQVSDFTEASQDAVGNATVGYSGITVVYSDSLNTLNVGLSGWLFTGITTHISDSTIHFTQAQINIPYTQISNFTLGVTGLSPTIAQFTGHTGNNSIHFTVASIDHRNIGFIGFYDHASIDAHIDDSTLHYTQAAISITASQVSDFTTEARTQVLQRIAPESGIEVDNTTSPTQLKVKLSGWLFTGITGHIGNTGIHFTQSQISIPSTQISNFSEATQDVIGAVGFIQYGNGLSGTYNDAGNSFTLSGILSTSALYGVSKYNPIDFSVTTGYVTLINSGHFLTGHRDVRALTGVDTILGFNPTSGAWTDFKLTGAGNVAVTRVDTTRQFFVSGNGLTPNNNLSDITNNDTARTNLRVRYEMDDLAPCDFTTRWSSSSVNGGGAYNYDPTYVSILRDRNLQGVVIATNGSATGATGAGMLYHTNQGVFLSSGSSFYFNVMLATTGTNFARFGLFNTVPASSTGTPTNGVFFEYDSRTGATWQAVAISGGVINRSVGTVTGLASSFNWFCIENVATGYRFYDCSNNNRQVGFLTGSVLPSTATSYSRAFIQCIGNGGQFNGIYLDKFMYPIYASALPSGIA